MTCWLNRPQDLRDRALILVAFASVEGGAPKWQR